MQEKNFTTNTRVLFDSKHRTFDLRGSHLPIYTEQELKDISASSPNFFQNNDFLVLTSQMIEDEKELHDRNRINDPERRVNILSERGQVGVKLGNLYIEYFLGGKQSFTLSVAHLDFKQKNAVSLIRNLGQMRYGNVPITDIVPFYPLYSFTQYNAFGRDQKYHNMRDKASLLRTLLTNLILGEQLEKRGFIKTYTDFLEASHLFEKNQVEIPFIQRGIHTPDDIKKMAEKLFLIYAEELEITKKELSGVLKEYQKKTRKEINKKLIKQLLTTMVDHDRFELRGFIELTDAEIKEVINLSNSNVSVPQNTLDVVIDIFKNSLICNEDKKEVNDTKETPDQFLIKEIKTLFKQDLDNVLNSELVNITAQTLFKLGFPVGNIQIMKELHSLVTSEDCNNLSEFSSKLDNLVDKLKPSILHNGFVEKANAYQATIHNYLVNGNQDEQKQYP